MNALAVANEDQLNAYAAHLQQVITAPLAGDPRACVMESGWFYDTNFHLNTAGRTVFTRQLIRDIKAMLGDTTATEIALPAMPEPAANTAAGSGSSTDVAYFTMAEDGSVTVNAAGRARRSLTVPRRDKRQGSHKALRRDLPRLHCAGGSHDTVRRHRPAGRPFCRLPGTAYHHSDPA